MLERRCVLRSWTVEETYTCFTALDANGGVHAMMRATFLLDKKRTVIFAEACPINIGRSVDETLRIVRAYRSGRLCPSDWKPGDAFGPGDRKY